MGVEDFQLYKGAWISKIPPHLTDKSSDATMKLLLKTGGYLVRNTFNFDCNFTTDFWFVIKDNWKGLDEYSSKTRNQIKKSLRTYNVTLVSPEVMLKQGYTIFSEAIKSYKVATEKVTVEQFEERVRNGDKNGNTDFWMVYEQSSNKPVALAINTVNEDCCEYNTMKALPWSLKNSTYPYYGLIYKMSQYYLETRQLKYVNDGSRTITEHSNVQSFLIEKFKFRKAYCQLQIKYKWWLKILICLMYPFRTVIPIRAIKSLLIMEKIRRDQCKMKDSHGKNY